MLRKILKINGVLEIEKQKQQQINGGRAQCAANGVCFDCGHHCAEVECCYCIEP